MKRVVVTGASGFVGRHCLPELQARGFEVHAWARNRPQDGLTDGTWHTVDLLDHARCATLLQELRPSHLLHLAWITDPQTFWTSPENETWVRLSNKLIASFRKHGGQRAVVAGSCAEYAWDRRVCHETDTPIQPSTKYGQSKATLHQQISRQLSKSNTSLAWARIFFLYGPGGSESRIPGAVVHAIEQHTPLLCSSGEQVRDFLHVADCAAAMATLLDSRLTGPMNVAAGRPVPLRNIIRHTAELMGRPDLVRFGALPTRPGEPAWLTADTNRLNHELGWVPQFSLATGLKQYVHHYRQTNRDDFSRSA